VATDDRQFESRQGNERLVEDDNFHTPETDAWWEHETVWFWWFHPERRMGCWIYHYVRPNVGVAGGGVFVFDDTAWFHMETPYCLSYSNTALAPQRDLRDFTFPGGSRIQMLEPLRRYRLSYADRDTIRYDLEWAAAMPPWVDVSGPLDRSRSVQEGGERKPRHLDQFGHITGELELHGDHLDIDCYAMRDRSWWHLRPEPWKTGGGRSNYITAMASPDIAFFGAGPGGFFIRDGVLQPLVAGEKHRQRDPERGYVRSLQIDAVDQAGRELHVEGESVSRMAIPIAGVHGVCWQSLMRYSINGIEAWGDDQDAWPIHEWSAFRRAQMGLKDTRAAHLGDVTI
jgi:hypothetical protein